MRWLLALIILCLEDAGLDAASDGRIKVTIVANITSQLLCTNQSVLLTCHADDVTHPSYQWTSSMDQLNWTSSDILVTASDHVVNYTCTVTSENDGKGDNSISILSNGTVPYLYRENFNEEEIIMEGGSVNLTVVNNHSTTSHWHRTHAPLPDGHMVHNYSIGGTNYSSLTFSNASYSDDGGEYVFSGSNDCGDSDVSVDLNIEKPDVQCFPPGTAVPLVSKSVNKSIVEEEVVKFSCIYGGNYDPIDYSVIWSVTPLDKNSTYIDDESNIAGFEVTKPKQDCPHSNYSCCKFTTELKIYSNMSLNGAAVTCLVLVLEQPTSDTSYLSIYKKPTAVKGPDSKTLHKHDRVEFTCKFVASSLEHFTHAAWKRNDDPNKLPNKAIFTNQTSPGNDTLFVYSLILSDVTESDEGTYSCYSYYNQTILKSMGIDHAIESDHMSAYLRVKGKIADYLIYGGASVIVVAAVIAISIVVSILVHRRYRGRQLNQVPGEEEPLHTPIPAEGSDSDTDHSTEHDGGHHRRHLIHRRNQYGSFSSRSLPTAVPKSNVVFETKEVIILLPTDTRPHMQALRDHVISQISEDKLQPLAYKLGLSQEVIDQLPEGKQGFEVILKKWLKSGQRKWNDLVVALCCPQVDEQQLSDQLIRKLQSNVIEEELLKLTPTESQLCQYVVDMVAPDWCALAAALEVNIEGISKPVTESCMTMFCEYLKRSRPSWRHILSAMTGSSRESCAKFITRLLPEIVDLEPLEWREYQSRKVLVDMYTILTELHIIQARPFLDGWLVDSRTLLEAVNAKVPLNKGEIDEILNAVLLSKDRSVKVVRLLWRKLNASLYTMLAERYRPGSSFFSGGTQNVSINVHHSYSYGTPRTGYSVIEAPPTCDTEWGKLLEKRRFELCERLEPVVFGIFNFLCEIIPAEEKSKINTAQYASDYQKVSIILTVIINSNNKEYFDKFCESLCELRHTQLAEELKSKLSS